MGAAPSIPERIQVSREAFTFLQKALDWLSQEDPQKEALEAILEDRYIDSKDLPRPEDPLFHFKQRFYVAAYHYAQASGARDVLEEGDSLDTLVRQTFSDSPRFFPHLVSIHEDFSRIHIGGGRALFVVHAQRQFDTSMAIRDSVGALVNQMRREGVPYVYVYAPPPRTGTELFDYYLLQPYAPYVIESGGGWHHVDLEAADQEIHFAGGFPDDCLAKAVQASIAKFQTRPGARSLEITLHTEAIYTTKEYPKTIPFSRYLEDSLVVPAFEGVLREQLTNREWQGRPVWIEINLRGPVIQGGYSYNACLASKDELPADIPRVKIRLVSP
ncbi:MAG: hypothetical protein HYS22_07020 [Deltaproteobacteria bacterium]|nr:hypothetical protein [Deltaproteobacteria bacterium]